MNELGFTETLLRKWFDEDTWNKFIIFMRGQTYAQVDGENTYYFDDVARFIESKPVID